MPSSQSTSYSFSLSSEYQETNTPYPSISTAKPLTVRKTDYTIGTSLKLSSEDNSQVSVPEFNLARNLFVETSQESFKSQSTHDLGEFHPTYSMIKIGLARKLIKPQKRNGRKKYPNRNKTSPVRWWLGERTVYNDDGYLIAKDIRR